MKQALILAALLPAAFALDFQEPNSSPEEARGLFKVQEQDHGPDTEAPRRGAAAVEFDAAAWRERLTDADLDSREVAFGKLERILRGSGSSADSAAARTAVENWAAGRDELAWTARLLLRSAGPAVVRPQGFVDSDGNAFFGSPIFRDDLFEDFFTNPQGVDPFRDIQERMERLQEMMMRGNGSSSPFGGVAPGQGQFNGSGMSIQQGPDGVRVEITETDGSGESKKVYEAESMEKLLEEHPDLKDRIQVQSGGPRLFGGLERRADPFFKDWDELFPGRRDNAPGTGDARGLRRVAPRTDILGVYVAGGADGPLTVSSVESGSLAEALGVQAGDELLDLNGTRLRTAEDIRSALAGRAPGDEIVLLVRNPEGVARTLRHTPDGGETPDRSNDSPSTGAPGKPDTSDDSNRPESSSKSGGR